MVDEMSGGPMRQSTLCAFILLGIVLCAVMAAGCTDSITKPIQKPPAAIPEPETGIVAWIMAVNDHDFVSVYDLAPYSVKKQVGLQEFIAAQRDNPLLAQGNVIKGYTIMDKTASGNDSAITAQLIIHSPSKVNQSEQDIALYIKFVETFEDGAWHVWTEAPF
jgi:hypothetical protein